VFIDEIRRFVESFCSCACPGTNREAQLALAVHELMQNAIPHAQGDDVDLLLEVEPATDRVSVAVTNRATEQERAALADRVNRMNRERDALAHYLRMMAESPVSSRGGLGLARVRFEAQLDVSTSYAEGRVTVRASGLLRTPALQFPGVSHG
jgi:anti-sigma regulatory factor (Ser/Thr protein kinase)